MDASSQTPLVHYSAALGTLENAANPSQTTVLAVLLARDQLRADQLSTEQTLQLLQLDQRLRHCTTKLLAHTPLEQWRQSLSVDDAAWWWNLEAPVHRLDRFDWLWNAGTVSALAASASLVVDISSKFLAVTPGLLGSFAVVGQGVLTLVTAGGVLTDAGRQGVEQALASLGIRRYLWQETKLGLSILLLLGLVGFRTSLPRISQALTAIGNDRLEAGELTGAEDQLKRALSLDGDNATAHFHLAEVYDTLGRVVVAAEQYQIAAQAGLWRSYVNLADLYLEEGLSEDADPLIDEALSRIPETADTEAVRTELSQRQTGRLPAYEIPPRDDR